MFLDFKRELMRLKLCPICRGIGEHTLSLGPVFTFSCTLTCMSCQGKGYFVPSKTIFNVKQALMTLVPCADCNGRGYTFVIDWADDRPSTFVPCKLCIGKGY